MNKLCAKYLINDLPSLICCLRQQYCSSEGYDPTLQQYRLMILIKDGGKSTSEISKTLGVSLPAVSRMCLQLAELGWVSKSTSMKDRRSVKIVLSVEGRRILKMSMKNSTEKLENALSQLSEREMKTLINSFEILNNLKKILEVSL